MDSFRVSIVIPVFNEELQLSETIRRIDRILATNRIEHDYVIVDDGSTDGTWNQIQMLALELPDLRALRFSRNFGKEAALCAGLTVAGPAPAEPKNNIPATAETMELSGHACITMDADLQHPPEIIPEMVRRWRAENFPIVEAVKKTRGPERLWHRIGARIFYRIMNRLSGFDLHNASDFKLMDAAVIAAWLQMAERNTFYRGMTAWVGFDRARVDFEVSARGAGRTKWSKLHLFKLAVTAITSFSTLPLHIVTMMGVLFMVFAIPLGIQTLYMKFVGHAVSGFTTVILLLLIIGSCLMLSLGIIGTYIAKIYEEVKHRPRYLIAETLPKVR